MEVKLFKRKELHDHFNDCPSRKHTRAYCEEEGTYASIMEIHDKTCKKKVVPCRSPGCPKLMQRQHVGKHIHTTCEFAVIPCKYEKLGCDIRMRRKDMLDHEENDSLHLHMAIDKINFLLQEKSTLKFKLKGFDKMKENKEDVTSLPFYVLPRGYRMSLQVYANGHMEGNGTHVSVFASIIKGDYDSELKWPLVGKIKFTLMNQQEDRHHHCKELKLTADHLAGINSILGLPRFIRHCKLSYYQEKNTHYLKDDTLYFRMEVEVANHKPWLE